MKLQGVHDGEVYATSYRTLLRERSGGFERVGRLPIPDSGRRGIESRLKTSRGFKSVVARFVGQFPSVNAWWVDDDVVVASAERWVFTSVDGGRSFRPTLELPPTSGPAGVTPSAFCEHDDDFYLGEYPLATDTTPRIWRSTDLGHSWEMALTLPGVRHFHAIQVDPYTDDLWVTTGDAEEACRIGRLRDTGDGGLEFEVVASGDQRFRAVELAFTPEAIVWGVDSCYADSNPVYRLPRDVIPNEDTGPVGDGAIEKLYDAGDSVYYAEGIAVDGVEWIVLSTTMEPGVDRTGPADQRPTADGRARVIAASDASDFQNWYELRSYKKRAVPADRLKLPQVVPRANGYVFLASDPDRGLFVNPYNTDRDGGRVFGIPPAAFRALSRDDVAAGSEAETVTVDPSLVS